MPHIYLFQVSRTPGLLLTRVEVIHLLLIQLSYSSYHSYTVRFLVTVIQIWSIF